MKIKSCPQKKRIPDALRKVGIQRVTDNLKGRKLVVPAELIMRYFEKELIFEFGVRLCKTESKEEDLAAPSKIKNPPNDLL